MATPTRMKRILVIDESEVVRETVALLLGREFVVSKRALGNKSVHGPDIHDECDLMILGVSPKHGSEVARIVSVAARLPFALLLLVDSKSAARAIESRAEVGCLTKPFDPYELHEIVGQLLARQILRPRPGTGAATRPRNDLS